jgi:hypothetical protein
VVQADRTGRPDVHRGTLPDGLEAFENLDLVGAVVVGAAGHGRAGDRRGLFAIVNFCFRHALVVVSGQIRIGMIT